MFLACEICAIMCATACLSYPTFHNNMRTFSARTFTVERLACTRRHETLPVSFVLAMRPLLLSPTTMVSATCVAGENGTRQWKALE